MSALKTVPNDQSVDAFLASIDDSRKQEDCRTLVAMMKEATGAPARMWGDAIVGFGLYQYKYASGRAGEWFLTGFSPRKQALTLYIMSGFDEYDELMAALGKHSTGKSCLYVKRLADVDMAVLHELVTRSVAHMAATNPSNT